MRCGTPGAVGPITVTTVTVMWLCCDRSDCAVAVLFLCLCCVCAVSVISWYMGCGATITVTAVPVSPCLSITLRIAPCLIGC